MANIISDERRQNALGSLRGWMDDVPNKCIIKAYHFQDFKCAFAWMTKVAMKAEQMDHHPDWSNVYKRVDVKLSTHDAGGVTGLDIEMAQFMEDALG
jgi:4a-hydroxytetrahydrobiopterin dehydratase